MDTLELRKIVEKIEARIPTITDYGWQGFHQMMRSIHSPDKAKAIYGRKLLSYRSFRESAEKQGVDMKSWRHIPTLKDVERWRLEYLWRVANA